MIRFRMFKIHTPQFAILEDEALPRRVRVDVDFTIKTSEKGEQVAIEMSTRLLDEEKLLLTSKTICEFEIHPEDWESITDNGKTTIPKDTIDYFLVQTVGAVRGILSCKTEGTPYGGFVLQPLDVSQIIQEPIVVEEQK